MMGFCVSDVAFYILVKGVSTDDKEAAAPHDMLSHIQTQLVFAGVVLMEKDGLVGFGADRVIPGFKQRSGIEITFFNEIFSAAPCSSDVSKR